MKYFEFAVLVVVALLVVNVNAGCEERSEEDTGKVAAWFRRFGCNIQKELDDLDERTKPWTEKIADSSKKLGSSVAQSYEEVKKSLNDTAHRALHNAKPLVGKLEMTVRSAISDIGDIMHKLTSSCGDEVEVAVVKTSSVDTNVSPPTVQSAATEEPIEVVDVKENEITDESLENTFDNNI